MGEAGLLRQVEYPSGMVVRLSDASAAPTLLRLSRDPCVDLLKALVGVAEENESPNGNRVLGGLQLGIRAELVRGGPEPIVQLGYVDRHEWGFCVRSRWAVRP